MNDIFVETCIVCGEKQIWAEKEFDTNGEETIIKYHCLNCKDEWTPDAHKETIKWLIEALALQKAEIDILKEKVSQLGGETS
jgi:hypothetical protein